MARRNRKWCDKTAAIAGIADSRGNNEPQQGTSAKVFVLRPRQAKPDTANVTIEAGVADREVVE